MSTTTSTAQTMPAGIDPTDPSISTGAVIDGLPQPLTDAQVKAYVENGYHVAENLLDSSELDELKADALALARGAYPCDSLQPVDESLDDAQVLQRILCIHQPHYISPTILKYVKHPKICGILSQIVAAHLPWWDGSVKCMQSMFFVKPPTFQGQAWHQDEIYIPTRDRSLTGAWIAVDDATHDNGCLWVIPGSHRSGYMFPQREHTRKDEWDFAAESYGFDDAKAVKVEVPAGSVVFFNGYTLHCSFKNRSNIYRRALVSHYMNAYSMLPWYYPNPDKPIQAPVSQLDDRRVVHVAGQDPYLWKGYDQPSQEVWLRTCKANTDE